MCIWTKIKKISAYVSFAVVSISLLFSIASYFGWKAIADDRIDTMWWERGTKTEEIVAIKDCIADMKTDMAIIKTDTQRIKEYLKNDK
jgi:hypothetical protein